MPELLYKRVLVKLAGEALAGEAGVGIDCYHIVRATEKERLEHGVEGRRAVQR